MKTKITKLYNHIKNTIIRFKEKDEKYNLTLLSAALAFYSILSISSLVILVFSFLNYFSNYFETFLLEDIIEIIGNTYSGLVNDSLIRLQQSSFSIVLVISVIYSSSSILNRYNHFTDNVYKDIPKRSSIRNRINSILMFLMLLTLFIFEIIIIFYSKNIIITIFDLDINNRILNYLMGIITKVLEMIIFFITLSLLYIYLPPIHMRYKMVYKTSIITTLCIYMTLEVFRIVFQLLYKKYELIGITYVFTISGFLFFMINYFICMGIIRNYKN